ncbi:MAG: DUF4340 domain-containing protein [Spirochaetaceae bacterium]|nr:DUF4340 domain-containing protein [Spirochaetaceae bacterium]
MSPRTTGLLALVALVLGAFVVFYELGGEGEREAARDEAKRIHPGIEAEEITSVALVTRDGQPARFERSEGRWRMVEPFEDEADGRALDAIAFALADLPCVGRVDGASSLDPFGLGDTARVVRFQVGSGAARRMFGLRIGGATPVGGNLYLSRLDDDEVVYAERYRLNALDKDLADLRERQILDFDTDDVRSLRVAWTDDDGPVDLELVRVDEPSRAAGDDAAGATTSWRIHAPFDAPADEETVEALLADLAFLRASGFVDASDPAARAAIRDPLIVVTIGLAGREVPLRLAIGGLYADGRLVEGPGGRLRTVAAERIDDVPRTLAAYRERTVSRFDLAEAFRVTLELRADPEAAGGPAPGDASPMRVVAELGGTGWARVDGGPALDPDRFSDFVRDLAGLRAADVFADGLGGAELESLGLSPPRVAIRVEAERAERPLAEVALGRDLPGRGLVAMRGDEGPVFVLAAQATLDLPGSSQAFAEAFLARPTSEGGATAGEIDRPIAIDPLDGIDLD